MPFAKNVMKPQFSRRRDPGVRPLSGRVCGFVPDVQAPDSADRSAAPNLAQAVQPGLGAPVKLTARSGQVDRALQSS